MSNDTLFVGYGPVYIYNSWGNDRNNYPNFFDGYIGFRKRIGWRYLSDVSIGIFGTFQNIPRGMNDVDVRNGHFFRGAFQYYDVDTYTNREYFVGVKLGFGLNL